MVFGGRDEQRLREAVKRTEGVPLPLPSTTDTARLPLPVLGRATQHTSKFQIGDFVLLANLPIEITETETVRKAYAFCDLAPGDDVIMHRMGGQNSNGYWLAVPCEEAPDVQYPCPGCSTGFIPQITISIAKLVDTADTTFDGWATRVNGTWDLIHHPPYLACAPGVSWIVPDNRDKQNANPRVGNRLSLWFFSGGAVDDPQIDKPFWTAEDTENPEDAMNVYYEEGATKMTRDSDNKLECDQRYDGYVQGFVPDFPSGALLAAWLTPAVITLNSTS